VRLNIVKGRHSYFVWTGPTGVEKVYNEDTNETTYAEDMSEEDIQLFEDLVAIRMENLFK